MNILMMTSECHPFAKTGGLGDVLGSLPKALAKEGAGDIRVVMPNYGAIPAAFREKMRFVDSFYVSLGWRTQYCGVLELVQGGVTFYFLDNEFYFSTSALYTWNDMERFIFFQRAALEMLPLIGFHPDVIHCHDWQTGLVPVLLREQYATREPYRHIKTVMTIHNLKYQGVFNKEDANEMLGLSPYCYTPDKLEFYGGINFLKAGLVYADFVTTVSVSYAQEIQSAYFGEHLDGLLRSRRDRLGGILNGIDYEVYSPAKDRDIFYTYNARNFVTGKRQNKLALQQELGLDQNAAVPVVGVVTRLADQKGLDLIAAVMEDLMALDLQMVVLGTGERKYEQMLEYYAWKNPGRMAAVIGFDNALAKRIYAGSDLFLMPSRFEPCGLSQMISLAYGTVPVVREVGGLKDTVEPYNELTGEGNGFCFWAYNAHDMLSSLKSALTLYGDKKKWNQLVRRGMKADFSWDASARHYLNIYRYISPV